MDREEYLVSLKESIVNLDFNAIAEVAKEAMDAGVDPHIAITDGMVTGMTIVGEKFESGEYFLSELIVAGEIMRKGMEIINPYIKGDSAKRLGKVVIATVEGDNHDLGKSIVTTLLKVYGFEMIDLGIDVPTDEIIGAVKEHKPVIVGLSALLTQSMPEMGEVIKALKTTGLREKVKVIVGGSPVTPEFAESIGADHCAINALEGIKKCLEWVSPQEVR
jgi:corrinoid protein of di/trimethylamine methyltransferase